ncbi:hypothetical protein D3C76_1577270 [compost metagenome]
MEFEIEKYIKATLLQVTHDLRSKQGEHLFADFEAAVAWVNAIDKGERAVAIVIVECNNNGRFSNYAGRRGCNRRHDQPFSSMGAAVARDR